MNEKKETQEKKSYEAYTYYADVDGHSKEVQIGETIPVSICINTSFGIYTPTIQVKITENNLEALIKEDIVKRASGFPTVDMCIDNFVVKNKIFKHSLVKMIKGLPQMTAYTVLSSIMAEEFLKDEYNHLWSKLRYQLDTYNLNPIFKSEIVNNKLPIFPNLRVAEYVSEEVKKYYKECISK